MRFEMFVAGEDGKEMKMLSIAYTRSTDDGSKGKEHGGDKPKSGGK